jgi:hypothetical protein
MHKMWFILNSTCLSTSTRWVENIWKKIPLLSNRRSATKSQAKSVCHSEKRPFKLSTTVFECSARLTLIDGWFCHRQHLGGQASSSEWQLGCLINEKECHRFSEAWLVGHGSDLLMLTPNRMAQLERLWGCGVVQLTSFSWASERERSTKPTLQKFMHLVRAAFRLSKLNLQRYKTVLWTHHLQLSVQLLQVGSGIPSDVAH